MPGPIQSIERAAAVLSLIGAAPEPLSLADLAGALGLPKTTAHGILATLVDVDFVHQGQDSRYTLGQGLWSLQQRGFDRHDVRSRAMTWCDALASRSQCEVLLCAPAGDAAEVVHHVFRPDGSAQTRRLGEQLPLHATGLGKVLLANSAQARGRTELVRYTSRTLTNRTALQHEVNRCRTTGWGAGRAEYQPETGDIAAPIRGLGGLTVGALACTGPVAELFAADGTPRGAVRDLVVSTAAAVSKALVAPR